MYESPALMPLLQEPSGGTVNYAAAPWYNQDVFVSAEANVVAIANAVAWANALVVTLAVGALAVVVDKIP